jgi:tripartite-type tricarboxylate transporter receptor subunit TctC
MKNILKSAIAAGLMSALLPVASAHAEWKPQKPIELIVSAGPGGGSDQFARTVQSIIQKYKLADVPVIVTNKGGGAGAEAFLSGKAAGNDPNKLMFGNNNAWLLPMKAKVAYTMEDLTPVAAMAGDEFILWVPKDSPYKAVGELLAAAKEKPGTLKMGGTQSKDGDHILTVMINEASGGQFTYVPFKSGNEAAVQLAGGHLDANTNNPSENLGQWKSGAVRALCVFASRPIPDERKIAGDMALSDIPTCASQGLPIENYILPRTIFGAGKLTDDQKAFYTDLLGKVRETEEWKTFLENTAQVDLFATGEKLDTLIKTDADAANRIFERENWRVN